jgi:hypothetical protein
MHYPTNYGYVPKTLSGDGDPVDVLVITPVPLIPGVVVPCRPMGILKMEDEAGVDGKVLAVPTNKILSLYTRWKKPEDLNPMRLKTPSPLLRALQGPGRRQVGQGAGLGRPRGGHQGNHGRHCQLRSLRRQRAGFGYSKPRNRPWRSKGRQAPSGCASRSATAHMALGFMPMPR